MITEVEYGLARFREAAEIGTLSRDLIEHGLGWSWTPQRVARHIRRAESVVLVARCREQMVGFAIMGFAEEHAHLDLLAVTPEHRRRGIGRSLLIWLWQSALVAGISLFYLEVRASNRGALQFYRGLGFESFKRVPGYYSGRESAICMACDLWSANVDARP